MGWYESVHGGVMGDPVADMIDELGEASDWRTPDDIPSGVHTEIVRLYREGLGREPTADDLNAVVGYAGDQS